MGAGRWRSSSWSGHRALLWFSRSTESRQPPLKQEEGGMRRRRTDRPTERDSQTPTLGGRTKVEGEKGGE